MMEMTREMAIGKIHRAVVTGADLHYVGSITVDEDLLDAANIVDVYKRQAQAHLRGGDGHGQCAEGGDRRGGGVDQVGQERRARGLERVLGVEVAVLAVGVADVDVVQGGDAALAVGGEGRGGRGDLDRVRGRDQLVVDLRGEMALEESDHDRAGQREAGGQQERDERDELRGEGFGVPPGLDALSQAGVHVTPRHAGCSPRLAWCG